MANSIAQHLDSNGDHMIAEIQKNATSRVRISLTFYRGRQYVDARLWVVDQHGKYRPTRQGISLRPDQVAGVVQGLLTAGRLTAEVSR